MSSVTTSTVNLKVHIYRADGELDSIDGLFDALTAEEADAIADALTEYAYSKCEECEDSDSAGEETSSHPPSQRSARFVDLEAEEERPRPLKRMKSSKNLVKHSDLK
jgi:hypothetical protein